MKCLVAKNDEWMQEHIATLVCEMLPDLEIIQTSTLAETIATVREQFAEIELFFIDYYFGQDSMKLDVQHTGIEAIRTIRTLVAEQSRTVFIVLITGATDQTVLDAALTAGADRAMTTADLSKMWTDQLEEILKQYTSPNA